MLVSLGKPRGSKLLRQSKYQPKEMCSSLPLEEPVRMDKQAAMAHLEEMGSMASEPPGVVMQR